MGKKPSWQKWIKKHPDRPDTRPEEPIRPVNLKCSDCGRIEPTSRYELLRAARLRCPICGGPLNQQQHFSGS